MQHKDNSNIQYIKNIVCQKSQTRIVDVFRGGETSQMWGSDVLVLTVWSNVLVLTVGKKSNVLWEQVSTISKYDMKDTCMKQMQSITLLVWKHDFQ